MQTEKPSVYIPRAVFIQIMHWIDKAKGEVGGMGTISYDKEGNFFWVREVFLVKQEVTGGTTDLDDTALGQLEYQLHKNGTEGDLNFWWHSHVNMGVFWSGTDKSTIEKYADQGYCLATVFNKKREHKSALCFAAETPYGGKASAFIDDLKTLVWDDQPSKATIAQWDKEFEEKVKDKVVYTPTLVPGNTPQNGRTPTQADFFNLNPAHWICPTDKALQYKLGFWRKTNPELGSRPADRDYILGAAITKLTPEGFDSVCLEFTQATWAILDEIVEEFKDKYPDFNWSLSC